MTINGMCDRGSGMVKTQKRGRPKLPANQKKRLVVTVRLSDRDRTGLHIAAKKQGVTPSKFMRMILQQTLAASFAK